MQSNTSGGDVYDGLPDHGQRARRHERAVGSARERILGIWENGHAHTSDITVGGNEFKNLAAGNSPATNLQRAFRVTSHSQSRRRRPWSTQDNERRAAPTSASSGSAGSNFSAQASVTAAPQYA